MKYVKPIILVIFIISAVAIGKYAYDQDFLSLENIQSHAADMGVLAPLFFMTLYFFGTIFFLPGTPLTILGGVLFGSIQGTLYTVIGATLGASAAFLLTRFLGKTFVDKLLKNKFKKLNEYDNKLEENGLLTMLFLRLVPLFPFNGLNFALGVTRIKFKDFFLGTLIGIIPGSFVLTNIGSTAADMRDWKFYLFIALFLLMAVIPKIYTKIKNEKAKA